MVRKPDAPPPPDPADDPLGHARWEMVERQLRPRGIDDERVLDAMRAIPREHFLPPRERRMAYQDRAVPIGGGQTLSQPLMVAAMTQELELRPEDRVLEIGTGSGYQTAVLARLAREVYSIERLEGLARDAARRLEELGVENVHIRVGDGTLGWSEEAPFDAILVTAAAPDIPAPLRGQLSPRGGRLVIPVGTRMDQTLVRLVRTDDGEEVESLLGCRFVPLLGREGWR